MYSVASNHKVKDIVIMVPPLADSSVLEYTVGHWRSISNDKGDAGTIVGIVFGCIFAIILLYFILIKIKKCRYKYRLSRVRRN